MALFKNILSRGRRKSTDLLKSITIIQSMKNLYQTAHFPAFMLTAVNGMRSSQALYNNFQAADFFVANFNVGVQVNADQCMEIELNQ